MRIKHLRESRNLTQQQLADLLTVETPNGKRIRVLSKYFRGKPEDGKIVSVNGIPISEYFMEKRPAKRRA